MNNYKLPNLLTPILLIVAFALIVSCSGKEKSSYKFANVKRGDIFVGISATGTVQPEETIDVGAQVAGLILSLGTDSRGKQIDYGSEVEEGGVLAQIDESLYRSDYQQAQAQLQRAKANLQLMQAKLVQADNDWKRAQKLGVSDALSSTGYDQYKTAYDVAKASVQDTEGQIAQAKASLERAERNLGYCVIKSPVKGVIIDRRVNVGQTVVSSLNAPSLFLIAKDLRKMQLWVSVNEADVGKIKTGQKVKFTVDAFPGEDFIGEVIKVRLNATLSQNVVIYIVEVSTDNSSGRLLPYLTANAKFEVSNIEDTLMVPSAALRWKPKNELATLAENAEKAKDEAFIWVDVEGVLKMIKVKVGDSDGINTAIQTTDLKEGDAVIVGVDEPEASKEKSTSAKNPFAPTMSHGGRKK
ncbi:MAG: efflux RND transporter periplasmic adaptor subunit [Proteobacteria bacterium]|nr:efflux RND transporter periplasmic adaptor subunit [Pseudomonadota bacterium]